MLKFFKTEPVTKVEDHFTLDNLIAWLETKRPETSYSFINSDKCLLAQWTQSVDHKSHIVESCYTYKVHGEHIDLERFESIVIALPRTMGDALARAKEMQKQENKNATVIPDIA